jgi:hypothetical protein
LTARPVIEFSFNKREVPLMERIADSITMKMLMGRINHSGNRIVLVVDNIWNYTDHDLKRFVHQLCRTTTHEFIHFFAKRAPEKEVERIENLSFRW